MYHGSARVEQVARAASLDAVQRFDGCTENKECVCEYLQVCNTSGSMARACREGLTFDGCTENKECNHRSGISELEIPLSR